jgi:iron(III) transport system substrate-binding protein
MNRSRVLAVVLVLLALGVAAFVFWPRPDAGVVLYCSVDQDHARTIVDEFERRTGIEVRFQGDTEASKSVGVAQRLYQERTNPVADVLWANEPLNTVWLGQAGVLAPLPAGVADDFPAEWRDPDRRSVYFAARARVILVNRTLLPDETTWPRSVDDLVDPTWGGEKRGVALSRPLAGTMLTHAAWLLERDEAAGRSFFEKLAARQAAGVQLVPGNGPAMRKAADASNGVAWALTDTDDCRVAIEAGDPVSVVYPDQDEGKPGTVVIPNTVSLVRGGKNPEAAEKLLRFLVSREVERMLAEGRSAQIPVRPDVPAPAHVKRPGKDFRAAPVDWRTAGASRDKWLSVLQNLFQK